MTTSSRIVLTLIATSLLLPFLFLFGRLFFDKFAQEAPSKIDADKELNEKVQAWNDERAKAGEPAISGIVTETWITLWPGTSRYAMVGPHTHLGVPGLLVTLVLWVLPLYCIWRPVV